MPMVEATYNHLHVAPRVMENFVELFETTLRSVLQSLRPANKDFRIYLEARAQSPISLNLPLIDVKVFYHAEWNFSERQLGEILHYLDTHFLAVNADLKKLPQGSTAVRFYRRDGHARISV